MARKQGTSAIAAVILAWAWLLVLSAAPPAYALHGAGLSCYDCHTLGVDTGGADSDTLPNSSYMNRRVRTLPTMLARGFTPDGASGRDFACTFCHSTQSTNVVMKDVISDFSVQAHKHPVGADYRSQPWTDTNWEWLSNGVVASSAGNLQCTGCHDPALLVYSYDDGGVTKYAYEHSATGWNKTVNPYALRDGNPATAQNGGNPATSPAEVNEFCSNLCHVAGPSDPVLDAGVNAHSASTANTTVRGVLNGFTNCGSCHEAHYADQANLIPSSVASPTNCRGCHKTPNYDGSAQLGTDNTTYYSGGHGKARKLNVSGTLGGTIAYTCTQCHDSGIPHDFATENRIPWDEATDQCGVCHEGTAKDHIARGNNMLCNNCHNAHGDGTGANMWMIKTVIATPNSGNQNVVLTARTGTNSFDDGTTNGENSICSACHTQTTHNNNSTNGVAHADAVNYEGQNCAQSCHPHDTSPSFQQECDTCHGYPPPPAFGGRSEGAHPRHNSPPYSYGCAKCHSGYSHQDFTVDVHKGAETPANQNPSWPTGSFTALSGDTCDSTNCHNPYRLDGDAATNNNPTWGQTNNTGCAFCHTGKVSGAHENHVAKGYACTVCHETWATSTAHVKGTLETTGLINFDNTLGIEATATFNETGTQCSNIYCHGDYGGGLNASPSWGTPASGQCGTCHTVPPTTGAHTLHLSGATGPRADCSNCHGAGAATGTHATHVDGAMDLGAPGELLGNTLKCDGCHGDNGTNHSERLLARYFWNLPAGSWAASSSPTSGLVGNGDPTVAGGSNYCQWCHDATPSVVNTVTGTNNNSMTAPDAKSNWASDNGGHGRSGVNSATGNTMPGYDCTACHVAPSAGAHIDGTAGNLDRLRGSLTRLTACADCHAPNQSAPGPVLGQDATVEASMHASSVLGHFGSNPAYNYACVACHNPHGTTNIAMVNTSITDGMGAAANSVTLAAETGLDPSATLDNGVCDRCHADGLQSHVNTVNPNNHNYGSACLQCHDHERSFEGSCSTCHGNNANQTAWPEGAGNARNLYPNRGGRHPLHVVRVGAAMGYGSNPLTYTVPQQRAICDVCHNDSTGLSGSAGHFPVPYAVGDEPANVGSFNQMWSPFAADGGTVAGYTAATYSGNAFAGGSACNAVDCHNGKNTPAGYEWYATSTTGCILCHADVTSAGVGTGQTHLAHVNSVANGLGRAISCSDCHTSAPAIVWGSPGTAPSASHINGTFLAAGDVGFTYAGVYPSTPGGCAINVCHNNGQNGAPVAYNWGTTIDGAGSCTECHNATSALATLSHPAHLTTSTGAGAVCANCHAAGSAGTHMNASVTFAAGITYTPASASSVAVNPTAIGGCGTNLCHNNGQNAAPLVSTYSWGTAQGTVNSCTECHTATSALATYSHDEHLGAATLFGITTVACTSCHAAATVNTHADGSVTMAAGGANYPAAATVVAAAGGTLAGCATNLCHNDGTVTGAPRAASYTWGSTIANCQECHGDTGATMLADVHPTHNTAAYGPQTACGDCHLAATVASHIDGTVTFDDGLALAATTACNSCHAGSPATAKTEWQLGAGHWLGTAGGYCEHCHDATPSVVNTQAGTGGVNMTAWGAMGDGSTYGAAVRGHGLASGGYLDADSIQTNVAANRPCTACHGTSSTHINNTNDTSYGGNRLLATVNNVPTGSTVSGLCNACHTAQGTAPSSSPVSSHGNQNASYTAPVRDTAGAENFTYRCEACHEPHGVVNGSGYVNIYMIRPTIGVGDSFTTLPGGSNTSTVTVRLQRISGTDSFDDTDDGSRINNVCYACHADANRPGSSTALRTPGGDHTGNSGPLKSNERGKNCVNCHMHSLDNDFGGTADGFMPLECDSCHTYPALATKPLTHRMNVVHDEHVGRPSDEAPVSNKGFSCNTCHYVFNHNQSNFNPSLTWNDVSVPPANINIRFDPNWNPGSPTYAGANASTQFAPGISGHNGQCAGLYCHSPGGTGTAPSWTGTLTACTACHADTTGTMATQSHDEHLTTATGAGAQCADCHTAYDLASTGNHMNGSVTFAAALTYTGNTVDKVPTSGQGNCGTNACHNDGQNNAPVSPYTWGSAIGTLNSCTECHNATSATLATLSHDEHLLTATGAGAVCDNCHASSTANTHANGSVTLAAGGANYPAASTVVAAGGGAVGGCGTNFCHNNGQNAAPLVSTYSWGTAQGTLNSCTECHSATSALASLSHDEHLTTATGAGAVCDNCHAASSAATHGNGSVTFGAALTYTPAAATLVEASGGAVGGCGTNVCHNNGQNAAPLVSTYSWGTAQGTLNSCTECHSATSALASLSHDEHLTTATGAGAVCANCHAASSAPTHTDASVTFAAALTYTPASASSVQVSPAAVGGCGTNVCHNNGQNGTPIVSTYSWGTAQGGLNSCTECHTATTSLATLSHDEHLGAATLFGINTIACASCHAASSLATHTDGSVTLAAGGSSYPAVATPVAAGGGVLAGCDTNLCHNDGTGTGAPRTAAYTWGTTIANCVECHGDTTGTVATGSHPSHFNATWGAALTACGTCHTAATATAHINGTASLLTAPGNTTPATLAASAICNNCHGIVTYDLETIKTAWADEAANTYAPGSGNPDVTCESCHGGGDMAAWQNANGTGGRAPAKTANFTTTGHGLTGSHSPSGRTGAGADCIDCHNEATGHVSATAGDTDRLDTSGNALCNGCHDGAGGGQAVTQVSTHGNRSATMGSPPASYTRQRAEFELNCVECHDAHGNGNIFMINTASPNGPLVATRYLNGASNLTTTNLFNGTVNFQDDTVGVSASAGIGFANAAADASKICQTCHTGTGGTYQHNQATTGHATSVCTLCHGHDIDANYAANSQDGFMPKGDCKDCHNGNTNYPLAPNVMTYWSGSNGSRQDGGHGDPQGLDRTAPPLCTDCHDISDPPGTHLNASPVYNSIWNNSTRNTNTSHLKTEYFSRSAPPSLPVGAGAWSVQVTFDRYCAEKCHQDTATWVTSAVQDMIHEKDTAATDSNHWSVQFGTHLTYTNGDTRAYPIDVDLNTNAAGGTDYATCASCHDPHGTGTSEPLETEGENHMLRDQWITNPTLCDTCHF